MDPTADLHGSAPDTHPTALLLVDVINPLDFPEAGQLLPHALAAADELAELKRRAVRAGDRHHQPRVFSPHSARLPRLC